MKKRDFLKAMAVTSAATMAGALGIMPSLVRPRKVLGAERNKLIFISDLHMNIDADYSWLVDHAADLARFLDEVSQRTDVAELVILGDMVDHWVTPSEYSPQNFSDVLCAGNNSDIVESLKKICQNPDIEVTYVTGNHDMLSFEQENHDVLAETFPEMAIVSTAPGLGAYCIDNVIWVEHGHRYTLFNAPDIWSRHGAHLPLGYFISRLATSASITMGQTYTTHDVLDRSMKMAGYDSLRRERIISGTAIGGEKPPLIDDAFIVALFRSISRWTGHRPWDRFTMDGLDGFLRNPFVEGIALTYDTIFSGWPSRQDIVSNYMAVFNDLSLNGVANFLFKLSEPIPGVCDFIPRIVLFGHTHRAVFQYNQGDPDTIYANTGTWIDSVADMTWVEVEIDREGAHSFYTVSLWYYGETTPRNSATLSVQTG